MLDFASDLCVAALSADGGDHEARGLIGRAVADTLAVAAAGFGTPAVQRAQRAVALARGPAATWDGTRVACLEDAAMVNAAAAHALDFDDLDTVSSAHLSAVVLAALCSGERWPDEDTLLAAMHAALIVAHAVGRRLGRGHYAAGWHATATVGVLAATAACARSEGASPAVLGHALALAAAQAAGLRANFASMAKALQAGFAAAAARRSIRLASHGITAGDVFADGGFLALYAGGDGMRDEDDGGDPGSIAPKLFPCCFAAHRMVAAALEARATLGDVVVAGDTRIMVTASRASMSILRVDRPRGAVEAGFCAAYCVAVALHDGAVTLARFDDPIDPALLPLLDRITVVGADDADDAYDMRRGRATLTVTTAQGLRTFHRSALPGSADDPRTPDLLRAKIADCLMQPAARRARPLLIGRARDLRTVAPWLPGWDQPGR